MKKIFQQTTRAAAATCALAGLWPPYAAAAEPQPGNQLEEIVVTAQQRAQPLQDVPLSVTALKGSFLEASHLVDFNDLALYTPGFVSAPNYGYIRNSSMRGISNNQFGFADDPSIAEFVDGVYQGRGGTGMMVNALYDVDRVEIIKGPQAALFGRSSIAGAISIINNKPGDRFEADGVLGFGERDRVVARGAINLPLTKDLAVRVAEDFEHQRGYIRNFNGGPDLEPIDIRAARVTTSYKGFENLEISLKLNYERRKQSGNVEQADGLPNFSTDSTLVGTAAFSNFSIYDLVATVKAAVTPRTIVTSNTSWRHVDNQYVEDYDGVSAVVAGPYYQQSNDRLFQQDVRLNWEGDNRWALIAGGSYFHEKLDAGVNNWIDGNPTFTGFAFTGVPTPGLLPGDYSNAFNEAGALHGTFHGFSFFVNGSAPLIDRLSLDLGIRYNSDTKTYTQDIANPATETVNAGKIFAGAYYNWGYWTSHPITSDKTWTNTAGRAALTWKIMPDRTAYLSWSQGWKAGGIDSFKIQWPGAIVPGGFHLFFGQDAAALGANPSVYNPEKNTSIELGLKGQAFARRFGYDVALYNYHYKDLQVSVQQGGSSIIQNIGKATGRGAEVGLRLVPTSQWELFASGAYNFTEITSYSVMPVQVGQPLNAAPRYTGSGGASYSFAAPFTAGGRMTLAASANFRDRMRWNNQLIQKIPSYLLTNLRLTYSSQGSKYSVSMFADNVFDRFTYSRYEPTTPFLFPVNSVSAIGYPRTIGIDLRASW